MRFPKKLGIEPFVSYPLGSIVTIPGTDKRGLITEARIRPNGRVEYRVNTGEWFAHVTIRYLSPPTEATLTRASTMLFGDAPL